MYFLLRLAAAAMEAKDEARSNCVCQDLLLMGREHVYGMAVRDLRWAVNFETLRMNGDIMIDSMREMGIDKMPTRDNSSSKTYMTEYLQVRWRYQRDKRARGKKQKLPIPSFQTLRLKHSARERVCSIALRFLLL